LIGFDKQGDLDVLEVSLVLELVIRFFDVVNQSVMKVMGVDPGFNFRLQNREGETVFVQSRALVRVGDFQVSWVGGEDDISELFELKRDLLQNCERSLTQEVLKVMNEHQ
jgi:hypothetical protein